MDTTTKDILMLIETAVTAQFPTLSGQFCAEEEFLHIWKYSPIGIRYLPNFHLIFEVDEFGNVIARQRIFLLLFDYFYTNKENLKLFNFFDICRNFLEDYLKCGFLDL